jgi:RimJ/RimL family protein N-acetyltransferase
MVPPEEFRTKRLFLRRLVPEDAGSIFAAYAQDPQVTRYMIWTPHVSVEETRQYVQRCIGVRDCLCYAWVRKPINSSFS